VAVADLRRNSYSVRYSPLARPDHSVRGSVVSARRIRRRSGLLGARVDRFRVGAEPLPGNAGECGVWKRMQRRSCLQLSGLAGRQFGRHEQVLLSVMPVIAATSERVCAGHGSASVLASRDG
jgi:hypothetical protein